MLPTNFLLYVGEDASREGSKGHDLMLALEHPDDLRENLSLLGYHWRIKVTFKEPVRFWSHGTWVEAAEHTFPGFFMSREGSLCAAFKRPMRRGERAIWVNKIASYELVDAIQPSNQFKSCKEFARKFDQRFITAAEIQRLYDGTSGQHGGKYTRRDFHALGPKGLGVLERFLERYVGLDGTPNGHYTETKNADGSVSHSLYVSEKAWRHTGRDIKIEHKIGMPYIWYSSEFPGCGNGRYGLLASEKTFLWLEDD